MYRSYGRFPASRIIELLLITHGNSANIYICACICVCVCVCVYACMCCLHWKVQEQVSGAFAILSLRFSFVFTFSHVKYTTDYNGGYGMNLNVVTLLSTYKTKGKGLWTTKLQH